jgi:hypothetical protein
VKETVNWDSVRDQLKKAERWDLLKEMLSSPAIRDASLNHLRRMRHATLILLAAREELSETLVTELRAYQARVDALFLEAVDGYRGDGHDILPTYEIEMLVNELCQEDACDE